MANPIDQRLLNALSSIGAIKKADGSLGFADPEKDRKWQQFQADNNKRGGASAAAPDSTAKTLADYDAQTAAQAKARQRDNAVTLDYVAGQIPLLQKRSDIEVGAYGGKLGANVAAQNALLQPSYAHEQQLERNSTERLGMILGSEQSYRDRAFDLQEKQLQQQGTANILNLITNLALGGAALFA